MKLHDRINLIPRNNWDYGFQELLSALFLRRNSQSYEQNTINQFQSIPIWTKSGRASLYAIIKAFELPPNSEIGVPLFCCSVVFDAVKQAGMKPRFIDSDLNDANISINDLKKKISGLAAIVAVHMFGNPCDVNSIKTIAGTRPVIEDCAHAIFSKYKGNQTGLLTTASFYSFRCGKYISAGEGSVIFCRDDSLHQKIHQIVNSFSPWTEREMRVDALQTYFKATLYKRPWYGLIGYPIGMRFDKYLNLTSKDGFDTGRIAKTHHMLINQRMVDFEKKINIQTSNAEILLNKIIPLNFQLPVTNIDCETNWYQFALKFENENQRDAMARHLFNKGIDTSKYLHDIADIARARYGYLGDCSNAELLAKTILLIPIHYKLSVNDMDHIAKCINEFAK